MLGPQKIAICGAPKLLERASMRACTSPFLFSCHCVVQDTKTRRFVSWLEAIAGPDGLDSRQGPFDFPLTSRDPFPVPDTNDYRSVCRSVTFCTAEGPDFYLFHFGWEGWITRFHLCSPIEVWIVCVANCAIVKFVTIATHWQQLFLSSQIVRITDDYFEIFAIFTSQLASIFRMSHHFRN